MKRLLLVGLSVIALVACGDSDGGTATAVSESSAAPGQQNVTQTIAPSVGALPDVSNQIPALPPQVRIPTVPAAEPEALPGPPVVCPGIASPVVTDAVASFSPYFDDVPWVAYEMGDPCASFTWVSATSERATASSPDHHLFFDDGVYLGTATAEPYSFSSVVDQSFDTVTVNYRWLVGDEAFAAPEGGPVAIRYRWNGSQVTMLDALPPEITG
ncbi:hypothetical protein A2J03_20355 [Rhodococcus sp. EPR-157]|uniref:LppP/LprE family lipoprotein n=1 Tax=Rhodococcus sp. EPR-157 TaxID=1813677 RepID=UPI0007BB59A7|nr:LppP/LprE family lipoprotein [Rhodococcus sp. EPR-157]KZF10961.1 hypothetical protein A2J03_20355 [Rhodococcus sp. EPR-157]